MGSFSKGKNYVIHISVEKRVGLHFDVSGRPGWMWDSVKWQIIANFRHFINNLHTLANFKNILSSPKSGLALQWPLIACQKHSLMQEHFIGCKNISFGYKNISFGYKNHSLMQEHFIDARTYHWMQEHIIGWIKHSFGCENISLDE
jgi:hypothetical protein